MSLTLPIIQAKPGERIDFIITQALAAVAAPDTAYAYFSHNGVIVTVDKASTRESASADWSARLGILCETAMAGPCQSPASPATVARRADQVLAAGVKKLAAKKPTK